MAIDAVDCATDVKLYKIQIQRDTIITVQLHRSSMLHFIDAFLSILVVFRISLILK